MTALSSGWWAPFSPNKTMSGRLPDATSALSPWPSFTHYRSRTRCLLQHWSRRPSDQHCRETTKSPHLTGHDLLGGLRSPFAGETGRCPEVDFYVVNLLIDLMNGT